MSAAAGDPGAARPGRGPASAVEPGAAEPVDPAGTGPDDGAGGGAGDGAGNAVDEAWEDEEGDGDGAPGADPRTDPQNSADAIRTRRRLAADGLLEPMPLTEIPPQDRYCDLVLTGGVASGMAYPWAVVELARHYRFRSIGGTSVGAVAAALAAASEYGRCMNITAPFEVLRRVPLELASPAASGLPTKMLGLFQPAPGGRRLFGLLVALLDQMSNTPGRRRALPVAADRPWWRRWLDRIIAPGPAQVAAAAKAVDTGNADGLRPLTRVEVIGFALRAVKAYTGDTWRTAWRLARVHVRLFLRRRRLQTLAVLVLAIVGAWALVQWTPGPGARSAAVAAAVVGALLAAFLAGVAATVVVVALAAQALFIVVRRDLRRGIVANDMGLCRGLRQPGSADQGIVDWMHEGVQRAAGLRTVDRPLTFRDLWEVQRSFPAPAGDRHIRLEIMVTNVTLGRPYRFPLESDGDRLWYRPEEWAHFFPASVMDALNAVSLPYAPRSPSDPDDPGVTGVRELPVADLPIVVAARMSMSFPVLFSSVPVYAMDYEAPLRRRRLRRCQLSDGGLCSNFPIHLFDAAIPRWPTFGLWLTRRLQAYPEQGVWLPKTHLEGRADSFRHHLDRPHDRPADQPISDLMRFGLGVLSTMKDWGDHTRIRLPQVRNRVARIRLQSGEGQLFISMGPRVIRRMAWSYGTEAGRKLVAAFGADPHTGAAAPAWRDHLYVRLQVLLVGLQELLQGADAAARARSHTVPAADLLAQARHGPPLQDRPHRPDPANRPLDPEDTDRLAECMATLSALESALDRTVTDLPYRPQPKPELRLRPPV